MSTRVLVFPCSNEPGLEVIDALRRHPRIEVFGASGVAAGVDPSVSLLGDRRDRLPFIDAPDFGTALDSLCARRAIDLIFPTVDAVVATLAVAFDGRDAGPRLIGSSPEVAATCLSKSAVYERVPDAVPIPRPHIDGDSLPAFAKPDDGSGSRGIARLDDQPAVDAARGAGLLVQEYLPGREFTVDCLGGADGRLIACSPRERTLVRAGISRTSTCVQAPELVRHCEAIQCAIPLRGPWFAQFREDAEGVAKLMEVNCRLGGSSGATRMAGVNIPLMAVLESIGVSVTAPTRLDGVAIVRTLDRRGRIDDFDTVVWDLDDTLIDADGRAFPESVAALHRLRNRGKRQFLLSKNPNPRAALANAMIAAGHFEEIIRTDDKPTAFDALAARHGFVLPRTLMINDSGSERLVFQQQAPDVRTIAPDALPVLA